MSKIFGRKVDLGIFSSLNPDLIKNVKMEMHVIYEKRLRHISEAVSNVETFVESISKQNS